MHFLLMADGKIIHCRHSSSKPLTTTAKMMSWKQEEEKWESIKV